MLLILVTLTPVHAATQPSIPITGRYSDLTIKIYIPAYPKWAHDVVLNASIVWNRAQLWNLQNNPFATGYNFVETGNDTATSLVSFSMPAASGSIAVGWTSFQVYKSAPSSGSLIVSTQTYLTPTIFNEAQGSNVTARKYAFWIALHELGRVLGLGSIADGRDIMDCTYTPQRVTQTPTLSTLDLYALQVLAQGSAPNFVTLPNGVQDQFTAATFFLRNSAVSLSSKASLSSAESPSSTTSLSSTTATAIILPTAVTSSSSSVTFVPAPSKAQTSSVLAFVSFGTLEAIALAVVIALLGSVVLFMRRKKTPESTVTVELKPSPKAEPLEQTLQSAASGLSTGYGDLDGLLAGGLPKGYAGLLLSPRCEERDLLLRKIIGSALSAGTPTFYLSNDPSKIQEMARTYGEDFYALSPQAAEVLAPPANLYKIPSIESLSDLNTAFTKILELRVKQGTGNRLLIVDLLTYSRLFLVDKGVSAKKWFSDFLATRKAEDFTVLAFLNPLVASNKERQTLIDVFDGVIEIYEKELEGMLRRFLVIKRMYGHGYSDSELMLDKGKLADLASDFLR